MNSKHVILLGVLLALALAVSLFFYFAARGMGGVSRIDPKSPGGQTPVGNGGVSGPEAGAAAVSPLATLFSNLASESGPGCDRSRIRQLQHRLKEALHTQPPESAAAHIADMLRSGTDYATGLDFVVGAEGVMEETPTLRTLLLDLLGQTDPAISAELSREILRSTDSADEYALALRNLAWINHDRRLDSELLGWLQGMLARPPWLSEPTAGFLEAFDVAVELGAAREMAGVLVATSQNPSSPADQAAFMALDRIMINDAQDVLAPMADDPSFLAATPMHRASVFSRLDVRDPAQRSALASYLLSTFHAPGELDYFSRVFPNGNMFVGHRLITPANDVRPVAEIEAMDAATLNVLDEWAADAAFASRSSQLQAISERLRSGHPSNP